MKLFRCDVKQFTVEIVELPRTQWRIVPPGRLVTIATVAVIILTALAWGILS